MRQCFSLQTLSPCVPPVLATVVSHDGDTVWLAGEKIRIADIDTPEFNGICGYERRLALRARNRLVELLNVGGFGIVRTGARWIWTNIRLHRSGRSIGDKLVSERLVRKRSGCREP